MATRSMDQMETPTASMAIRSTTIKGIPGIAMATAFMDRMETPISGTEINSLEAMERRAIS